MIERRIASIDLPSRPAGLYEPVRYALEGGGKRLRPLLAVQACLACGGTADEAMPAALALEMFHNFTLVHDDIMDSCAAVSFTHLTVPTLLRGRGLSVLSAAEGVN